MEVAISVEIRIDDESNGGINWGLKVVENCHAYSAKRSGEVAPALVNPCRPFYEYHELSNQLHHGRPRYLGEYSAHSQTYIQTVRRVCKHSQMDEGHIEHIVGDKANLRAEIDLGASIPWT